MTVPLDVKEADIAYIAYFNTRVHRDTYTLESNQGFALGFHFQRHPQCRLKSTHLFLKIQMNYL